MPATIRNGEREHPRERVGDEGREEERHEQAEERRRVRSRAAGRDPRPEGDERAGRDEEHGHGTAGLGLASPFPTGAG